MELIEHTFRRSKGRMIAVLTKIFGTENIDLAEDVTQDAFTRALETWSIRGIPADPEGWLMVTAKNRALDLLRKPQGIQLVTTEHELPDLRGTITETSLDSILGPAAIKDDELRLMFSCCHPALSEEAQVALILYLLSGFSVGEIASAYVSSTAAIEKRISRSKRVLAESKTLFIVYQQEEFEERLPAVLRALYLLFNEGYHGASAETAVRIQLCMEAIRLVDLILTHPFGANPPVMALSALMNLKTAKLPGRLSQEGELASFRDQDRSQWDGQLLSVGFTHLSKSASGPEPTEYHLEAMLAATHVIAPSIEQTDWDSVCSLYDQLLLMRTSPVVELNRAIAIGYRDGAEQGLEAIRSISDPSKLASYPFFWAAQAEFELMCGQLAVAFSNFQRASDVARNEQERNFFQGRIRGLS